MTKTKTKVGKSTQKKDKRKQTYTEGDHQESQPEQVPGAQQDLVEVMSCLEEFKSEIRPQDPEPVGRIYLKAFEEKTRGKKYNCVMHDKSRVVVVTIDRYPHEADGYICQAMKDLYENGYSKEQCVTFKNRLEQWRKRRVC